MLGRSFDTDGDGEIDAAEFSRRFAAAAAANNGTAGSEVERVEWAVGPAEGLRAAVKDPRSPMVHAPTC